LPSDNRYVRDEHAAAGDRGARTTHDSTGAEDSAVTRTRHGIKTAADEREPAQVENALAKTKRTSCKCRTVEVSY